MVMKLDNVVPFGRSLDEYVKMFALTEQDLTKRILGVGDGPASFNAELTEMGGRVTSVDPLYQYTSGEIYQRFEDILDGIIEQVKRTPDDWSWDYHGSPDGLRENRIRVAKIFADDYVKRRDSSRYVVGCLPKLDIPDNQYDLILCSHLLFLYSDQFSEDFHLQSIREMLRLGKEVRIFPLLTLMLDTSPHLQAVKRTFENEGCEVSVSTVEYELQRGGNQMISIIGAANKASKQTS